VNYVDLPALAEEFDALCDVAGPLTAQRLAVARDHVAVATARLVQLDISLARATDDLEVSDAGNDYDFLVRNLLAVQQDISAAQAQVTASMQLLMRTNIALTAAATLAACEHDEVLQ
jgi:hypothetical protein